MGSLQSPRKDLAVIRRNLLAARDRPVQRYGARSSGCIGGFGSGAGRWTSRRSDRRCVFNDLPRHGAEQPYGLPMRVQPRSIRSLSAGFVAITSFGERFRSMSPEPHRRYSAATPRRNEHAGAGRASTIHVDRRADGFIEELMYFRRICGRSGRTGCRSVAAPSQLEARRSMKDVAVTRHVGRRSTDLTVHNFAAENQVFCHASPARYLALLAGEPQVFIDHRRHISRRRVLCRHAWRRASIARSISVH